MVRESRKWGDLLISCRRSTRPRAGGNGRLVPRFAHCSDEDGGDARPAIPFDATWFVPGARRLPRADRSAVGDPSLDHHEAPNERVDY